MFANAWRGWRASVLAAGLACAGASAHGETLAVDLRTDYRPFDEFVQVETVARSLIGPPFEQEGATVAAFAGQDWWNGRRIALLDVPAGFYEVTVTMRNGFFDRRAVQRARVQVRAGGAAFALWILKPTGQAAKAVHLVRDADGDGQISGGDVVRYEVSLSGSGGTEFHDPLGPGLRLAAGTVTTTHGDVVSGNGVSDTEVLVRNLGLTSGATATVSFEAEVAPVVENQGRFRVVLGGRSADHLTDDPSTVAPGDPTATPVACSSGGLEKELAACRQERDALEKQVAALEGQIEQILGDPDGDGVANLLDRCAKTPAGASVDERGCSQAQFCARFDPSSGAGASACRRADWREDEPSGPALDCAPRGGVCVAR